MKTLYRFFLGFILVTFFLSINANGIDGATGVYMMSIFCTAGVGGLFWLAVWYGTGFIADQILTPLTKKLTKDTTPTPPLSPEQKAIHDYIAEARLRNYSNEKIRDALEKNGWPSSVIDKALTKEQTT